MIFEFWVLLAAGVLDEPAGSSLGPLAAETDAMPHTVMHSTNHMPRTKPIEFPCLMRSKLTDKL